MALKLLSFVLVFPLFVWADTATSDLVFDRVVGQFLDVIINPAITLLFALALLYFFWGLFRFMMALSQGESGSEGRRHMFWGVIGLSIMFSVWGIVGIISNTLGVEEPAGFHVSDGFK